MDLSGLDVEKLKALAIEKWRSSADCHPVKAMPLDRLAKIEAQRGGLPLREVGGYFTVLRAIRGKTPREMEDILGFAPGAFASGVCVFKLATWPTRDQFQLRGYTQCPGGEAFDGVVVRRPGAARPEFYTKEGKRAQYPPGLAVEQWELILPVKAIELQRVPPGGRFTNWR